MPEICPHCNREYRNSKALGSHIRHMHKDVNAPPPPPPPLEEDESTKSPPEGKGASMTPLADFMASQDGGGRDAVVQAAPHSHTPEFRLALEQRGSQGRQVDDSTVPRQVGGLAIISFRFA